MPLSPHIRIGTDLENAISLRSGLVTKDTCQENLRAIHEKEKKKKKNGTRDIYRIIDKRTNNQNRPTTA